MSIDSLSAEIVGKIGTIKTNISNAITGKGVATSSSDSFATMATNIANIPNGGLTIGDKLDYSRLSSPTPELVYSVGSYVYYKETDGYISISMNSAVKKIAPDGTILWSAQLKTAQPYCIYRDTDGYIVGGVNYISKLSLDGQTIMWQNITIGQTISCITKDPVYLYYIVGGAAGNITKLENSTGAVVTTFAIGHSTVYQIHRDANGNYVCATAGGYMTNVLSDLSAKNWDTIVGHGTIYGFIPDGSYYVCSSYTSGYLSKVRIDGTGVANESPAMHSIITHFTKESDGYIVLSSNGYLTKVDLTLNSVIWDCNFTSLTASGSTFVKTSYGYFVIGTTFVLCISFTGTILWGQYLAAIYMTNASASNGAYNCISIEGENILIPGTYKFIKYPASPQYTYLG